MEEMVRAVSEHPLIAIAVIFSVLLILYFVFKSLVKLLLIVAIIAVAVGGYSYFKHPENRPANLKEAVQKVRAGTEHAVETGKEALEKGRELVGKGKEVLEKGKEAVGTGKSVLDRGIDKGKAVIDKGLDKGKEIVDKGKDVAGDIGEVVKGRKRSR